MVDDNKEKLMLIRKIADILEEYNLSEIFYKFENEKNKKISINLKKEKTLSEKNVHTFSSTTVSENKEIQKDKKVFKEENKGTIIKSPMVGTIFLSPEPNADPFVKEGDKIKEGETILIIEAMKTMNQIQATKSGVISKIFVENACPIDFGASLVEIK